MRNRPASGTGPATALLAGVVVIVAAFLGAAPAAESSRHARPATKAKAQAHAPVVVKMVGDQLTFDPPRIVIRRGQAVEWQNGSRQVHNIVDDASKALKKEDVSEPPGATAFDSGFLNPGQNYTHRFTVRGTYRYVCTLHEPQGMKGEIVVR